MPNVASFSGVSILGYTFGFSNAYSLEHILFVTDIIYLPLKVF